MATAEQALGPGQPQVTTTPDVPPDPPDTEAAAVAERAERYRRIRKWRALRIAYGQFLAPKQFKRQKFPAELQRHVRACERRYAAEAQLLTEAASTWAAYPEEKAKFERSLKGAVKQGASYARNRQFDSLLIRATALFYIIFGGFVSLAVALELTLEGQTRSWIAVSSAIIIWMTCTVLQIMFWRKPATSWLQALSATSVLLITAALVRLPLLAKHTPYFSSIDPMQHVEDQVAIVVLVEALLVGYASVLGASNSHVAAKNTESELIWQGFEALVAIRRTTRMNAPLKLKSCAIRRLDGIIRVLSSRSLRQSISTGNIAANLTINSRLAECALRMQELQVWLALPKLDTYQHASRNVAQLVAATVTGAYDYLPQPQGQLLDVPPRTRIIAAGGRVLLSITPVAVLAGMIALGLRLPDLLGFFLFVLTLLWLMYWLTQALKLDISGFTKFAADAATATKEFGGLGSKDKSADAK